MVPHNSHNPFVNDKDDACRRLQETADKVDTPDMVANSQPSEQQKHEAEIASMALAVLVRLTANAGGPQSLLGLCLHCASIPGKDNPVSLLFHCLVYSSSHTRTSSPPSVAHSAGTPVCGL